MNYSTSKLGCGRSRKTLATCASLQNLEDEPANDAPAKSGGRSVANLELGKYFVTARSFCYASTLLITACLLAGCGAATPAASNPQSASTETASTSSDEEKAANEAAANNGSSLAGEQSESTAVVEAIEKTEPPPVVTKTGKVTEITFDDLKCNMQEDIVFRPWMLTDRAKELDGSRIRLTGFMMPFDKQKGIENFVLLRNSECKFGAGGKADHLLQVFLQPGVTVSYKGDQPLEVVGTLKINPFQGPDGNTWCIYDLAGESATWKRR